LGRAGISAEVGLSEGFARVIESEKIVCDLSQFVKPSAQFGFGVLKKVITKQGFAIWNKKTSSLIKRGFEEMVSQFGSFVPASVIR